MAAVKGSGVGGGVRGGWRRCWFKRCWLLGDRPEGGREGVVLLLTVSVGKYWWLVLVLVLGWFVGVGVFVSCVVLAVCVGVTRADLLFDFIAHRDTSSGGMAGLPGYA